MLTDEGNIAGARFARLAFGVVALGLGVAAGQIPARLTLGDAEQIALHNHPRIRSASLSAGAARAGVGEAQAALYPQVVGNFTTVGADHSSTMSAGAIQTSSLYSRVAGGVTVSQLVTDFGRTANLAASAKLKASAQDQMVDNTRAAILLGVDQEYYRALSAESVLKVARAVVENRRLTLRQVKALAQSSLKSTLDVSFAEVALSDAELALVRAENDVEAGHARVAAAMGEAQPGRFELEDTAMPPALGSDPEPLVAQALKQRPDLAALELNRDAAQRFAKAEGELSRPSISLGAVMGGLPATDPRLRNNYSAAGVNVTMPILNGKLYAARQTEADLRSRAADQDVQDLAVQVSEQVRLAWLEADSAYRRLDVTARLVAQAEESLRLAQTRYDNGLGSIVELNQAQLSQVSAEITAATAKYEYLGTRAALAFVMGELR